MPVNYVTYRRDRPDGYGGVLLAVKKRVCSRAARECRRRELRSSVCQDLAVPEAEAHHWSHQ